MRILFNSSPAGRQTNYIYISSQLMTSHFKKNIEMSINIVMFNCLLSQFAFSIYFNYSSVVLQNDPCL